MPHISWQYPVTWAVPTFCPWEIPSFEIVPSSALRKFFGGSRSTRRAPISGSLPMNPWGGGTADAGLGFKNCRKINEKLQFGGKIFNFLKIFNENFALFKNFDIFLKFFAKIRVKPKKLRCSWSPKLVKFQNFEKINGNLQLKVEFLRKIMNLLKIITMGIDFYPFCPIFLELCDFMQPGEINPFLYRYIFGFRRYSPFSLPAPL